VALESLVLDDAATLVELSVLEVLPVDEAAELPSEAVELSLDDGGGGGGGGGGIPCAPFS
jgi:hypothetical protein